MKHTINNIQLDTATDFCYKINDTPLRLSIGAVYRNGDIFYIHGGKPLNESSVSETFHGISEKYIIIDTNEDGTIRKGEIEKVPYEWTEFITIVSQDDIINFLIEDIKNTSLEISNANIFLGEDSIKAKGLMRVYLHDCFFYKENKGDMLEICSDVDLNSSSFFEFGSGVFNAKIGNNVFDGMNKREIFPQNQEYFLKVSKCDKVISSYTNARGYIPTSCMKENADKDVIIIIRGKNES